MGVPRGLNRGQSFVIRFAAYTLNYEDKVREIIASEAPSSKARLGLSACQWWRGTRVNVRISSPQIEIPEPDREFIWNGTFHVVRFDATALREPRADMVVIHVDVAAEGLPLIRLRPEITVYSSARCTGTTEHFQGQAAPRSAFASYARADRRDVLSRVRSLQIFTGIDVFLDCLSIRPGEQWKPALQAEIGNRDVFWLFWSREAQQSEWVEWEWRAALAEKSIAAIQPHPLEPAEVAPPPDELASLQFGSMYEWYLAHLRSPRLVTGLRHLWRRIVAATGRALRR